MRLKERVAVITGGANGIGRAVALGFAKEGARVVIADIDEKNGAETVTQIEAAGGKAIFVPTNVADRDQAEHLIAAAKNFGGKVDILVTSAAILEKISIVDCDMEDWDRTMDTNIHGVMNCVQAAIPGMKEQGRGKIVIMSSLASFLGRAEQTAYAAAAGTLTGFTRNAAVRLGQFGIHVNSIAPGIIDTDFPESLKDDPEYRNFRIKFTPVGRIGKPEDVVGAALFLAGDESDFVTGETIVVDGGVSIHLNGYGL